MTHTTYLPKTLCLAVITFIIAATLVLAPSSQAASPNGTTVDTCYRYNSPTYGSMVMTGTVHLDIYTTSGWSNDFQTFKTQSNGCLRTYVVTGYTWRLRFFLQGNGATWAGATTFYARYSGYSHLGTVPVNCVGCAY